MRQPHYAKAGHTSQALSACSRSARIDPSCPTAQLNRLLTIFYGGTNVFSQTGLNFPSPPLPFADIQAFSDASSGVGVSIVIGDRWRTWRLLLGWKNTQGANRDIGWAEAVGFEMLVCTISISHPGLPRVIAHGDNTGVVEGWWTGRHHNPETNTIFRHLNSFLAQTNHGGTVHTRYIPSAENPADGPSRGKYPPSHLLLPRIPIPPPLVPFIIDASDPLTPDEQRPTPSSSPNVPSNSLHLRCKNI
jgi:hypothetical protein